MKIEERKFERILEKNNQTLKKEIMIEVDKKLDKKFKTNNIELEKRIERKLDERFKANNLEIDKKLKANNLELEKNLTNKLTKKMYFIFADGFERIVLPHIEKIYRQNEKRDRRLSQNEDQIAILSRTQRAEADRNDRQDQRLGKLEKKVLA